MKRLFATSLALSVLFTAAATAGVSWMSPGPRLPAVDVLDQDGRAIRFSELFGDRPVLVSFFFTGCTRICPPQTALLRALQEELHNRAEAGARPLLLSVSLNPLTDTPGEIRAYAAQFDARLGRQEGWLMLTGSFEELTPVWSAFQAGGTDPDTHSDTLWIGYPSRRQWTRTSVLSPEVTPQRLAELLLQAAP
ncbi:SCO family protein [Ancylobacter sp. 6x-1]|uniref:SCO family protein n=1 Tax=Ancylobacter crimeensis TaxID=2579147 RepID=A0ABT0DBD8_9HYPH|nr:SCO family protein [Ancylobacter crimeensis]MCK0197255.1 SCO family protein [Ancylobacter crimeensis]